MNTNIGEQRKRIVYWIIIIGYGIKGVEYDREKTCSADPNQVAYWPRR